MEKSIKLLQQSIDKWRDPSVTKHGAKDCPLCLEYNSDEMSYSESCLQCPIAKSTGFTNCRGTPYGTWCNKLHRYNLVRGNPSLKYINVLEALQLAASNEYQYLVNLHMELTGETYI